METVNVEDLKTLKKKYIGAVLDPQKVNEEYGGFLDLSKGLFELSFTYLQKWSGDEYRYELYGNVDQNGKLIKIFAPHCGCLRSDDARRSDYRGKRMEEYDYYRIDCKLMELVADTSNIVTDK